MNKNTVLEFINSINAHDVDEIIRFLSDDHVFIDAQGNKFKGKKRMKEGWAEYFVLFPDYTVEVEDVTEKDKIKLWQVYADYTLIFDIIKKNK